MATPNPQLDPRPASAKVKLLLNKQLINILKDERLPHTGVKAAMQARVISQIETFARTGQVEHFNRLRNNIYNPDAFQSPQSPRYGHYPSGPPIPSGLHRPPQPHVQPSPSYGHIGAQLRFKDSPFETIQEALTPIQHCPPMVTNRHSINAQLRLSPYVLERLGTDPSLRLMVYCGMDMPLGAFNKFDIAFPYQSEIKVNGEEAKVNLRGLKNKPGSTRPADITGLVRKLSNYVNTITLTYALTQKKFSFLVNLVRAHTVEELVARLRHGRSLTKESVVREMVLKAEDPDLVATSTVLSLKCPLSTLRLELPCRSTVCSHNQCFDATSFLQLQEQAPTWTCPICNRIISFEALVVDQYVSDILNHTSKSVEQVTIEPNGQWSQNAKTSSPPRMNGHTTNDVEDDDIVEIRDMRGGPFKLEGSAAQTPVTQTPPLSIHEAPGSRSSSSRAPSGKRPISAVIDLTLSDEDEDDEPIRPPKRQSVYAPPPNPLDRPLSYRDTPTNGGSFQIPRVPVPNHYSGALPRGGAG
ncbi:MAG: SUMO ligase siz1 [Caeruleum heppii]|nr:MAG: SUMO ligase siz1 [Caeruleum heppii]